MRLPDINLLNGNNIKISITTTSKSNTYKVRMILFFGSGATSKVYDYTTNIPLTTINAVIRQHDTTCDNDIDGDEDCSDDDTLQEGIFR